MRPKILIGALAAGALTAVAAVAVTVFALKPTGPQALVPACRDLAKASRSTPATAQFPGGETVESSQTQDTIVGVFDAQNDHGALTRYSYRCMLQRDSAGKYRIYDVTVR